MQQEPLVEVPIARGVEITSSDQFTAMAFKTASGDVMQIAIPKQNLGQMAAMILNEIVALSAKGTLPNPAVGQELSALPISVAGLAVAAGRTPTEVLLTANVGAALLTLAVDASSLRSMYDALLPRLVPTQPETRN